MWLRNISFFLFTLFSAYLISQNNQARFDKALFYSAIEGKDTLKINRQLYLLENNPLKEKEAYEGTLLMKKASYIQGAKNKLTVFKSGKVKLETALLKDSTNAEYHFLRLLIQENAPKILGYRSMLEKDNLYIRKKFKSLYPVVQQAIIGYSKQSNLLKNANFEQEIK
jgi:hypothetical protein